MRPAPEPAGQWAYGPAPENTADDFRPAPGQVNRSVIVLIHGGFWRPEYDRTHLRPMAAALAERGHEVVSLEYRRVPGDPDASAADIAGALELLGSRFPRRPLQVIGHSAGGHLALLAAAQPGVPLQSCLALAPVADLVLADALQLDDGAVGDFLGDPGGQRPDLDPSRLPDPAMPVTVLHGDRDTLVPLAISESYCRARGARLVAVPDCGHFELIDPLSSAWPLVLAELDLLAGTGPAPESPIRTADDPGGIEWPA